MSNLTPTTEQVRSWAAFVPDASVGMHVSESDAAAFDRWLARHEDEVKSDAWDEAYAQGALDQRTLGLTENPYREAAL